VEKFIRQMNFILPNNFDIADMCKDERIDVLLDSKLVVMFAIQCPTKEWIEFYGRQQFLLKNHIVLHTETVKQENSCGNKKEVSGKWQNEQKKTRKLDM
jgi:hypothetical protein